MNVERASSGWAAKIRRDAVFAILSQRSRLFSRAEPNTAVAMLQQSLHTWAGCLAEASVPRYTISICGRAYVVIPRAFYLGLCIRYSSFAGASY